MGCVEAYLARLHIDQRSVAPSIQTLQLLTERHLQYIPFENISMHKIQQDTEPVVLTRDKLLHKIVVERRGGCCLELNGAFGMLLQDLGYKVRLVPCWVFAGAERGHGSKKAKFRVQQTHIVLLVQAPNHSETFLVDVGLGEPPCHPLPYILDKPFVTPEGMKSRIIHDPSGKWIDGRGRERNCHILQWVQNNKWEHRLRWDVCDTIFDSDSVDLSLRLLDYHYVIPILTNPKSTFSRKLIICVHNRNEKVTLCGRMLKRTCPRFENPVIQTQSLDSQEDIKRVLRDEFEIEGCIHFDLRQFDKEKNSNLWSHL